MKQIDYIHTVIHPRVALFIVAFSLCCLGPARAGDVATLIVSNPDGVIRSDKSVHIKLVDLGLPLGDSAAESIVAFEGDRPVPAQT